MHIGRRQYSPVYNCESRLSHADASSTKKVGQFFHLFWNYANIYIDA